MKPSEPPGLPRRSFLHLSAFVILLSLWTWKLLEPAPVPEAVKGLLDADMSFFVAKCLHASGYALLTVLAATLPLSRRWRWGLVAFLAMHGAATEYLQAVLPFNRTGRVFDVMIDWLGVGLGLLALRWWCSQARDAIKG